MDVVPLGPSLLKKWRTKRGLSQAALGELLNVTATSVCDWENGKKLPTVQHALAIATLTKGAVPVKAWSVPVPPIADSTRGTAAEVRAGAETARACHDTDDALEAGDARGAA